MKSQNGIINRRGFLRASALAGGGLMLQITMPAVYAEEAGTLVGSDELNAYVKVASDGTITIYSVMPEMGQGIRTTLPMIIAEEMGAKWEDVVVVDSPVDAATFGFQFSGGSRSVRDRIQSMRQMGASAREMLISAAALMMEVDREGLRSARLTSISFERREPLVWSTRFFSRTATYPNAGDADVQRSSRLHHYRHRDL